MPKLSIAPKIEDGWKVALQQDFESNYFADLKSFLTQEKQNKLVFPLGKDIFNAFNLTPFSKVKVVIIGQDPYHSFEIINNIPIPHAHGLCFSIPTAAKKIPPSLKNIFKELNQDLGLSIPTHGNLSNWAKQGVLLLNATLTVRAHEAGSHQKKGWEIFTDVVIQKLSEQQEGLVFLLWGKFAQDKEILIDADKHSILKAAHPSPFSAYHGFFGCKHFSRTNEILKNRGLTEIDWQIK
ncbi:MAG: uracil-DNA glycosylase [Flavobacteriales bacterium CG_4_10_14_0_2_um_filter_32_8]|nr:MAG: uracil-DNA glycosylase [Flavobacteriales bacterium CG_4_10_14_0_2_um_filter_32_8]PJB14981.1 MAG: uracil-DNA glycosylase [Flavobacteriales bacterium CG_4_9_14_3_um_filter_32_8]